MPEPDPDDRDDDKSVVFEPYVASCRTHVNTEVDPHHIASETDRCEESNPDNSGVNPIGLDSCAEVQRKSVELPSHVSSAPIGHALNDSHLEEMQTEPGSVEARPMSQNVDLNPDDDTELRIIQDPVAMFCGRLQNVIQSLKYEVKPSEAATVLQTLIKIIRYISCLSSLF